MSTNFYLQRKATAGQAATQEHIGKRTSGTFIFQGQNYTSYREWQNRICCIGNLESIVDEYGRELTWLEFWQALNELSSYNLPIPQNDFDTGRVWIDTGFKFNNYEFS